MSIAILCSGQGRQHAAMFDLVAQSPAAHPVFEAAGVQLHGQDPRQWLRSAPPDQIYSNQNAQLLCCTQALAAWAALAPHADGEEIVLAGYSVGELAAFGCAGLFNTSTVLQLAQGRARAMDAACDQRSGLLAVRGLARAALEALCQPLQCEIAIILAADNFVVGGHSGQLQPLLQAALKHGAQRCVLLPVNIAAHTSMMSEASIAFRAQLRCSRLLTGRLPANIRLLSAVDGDPVRNVGEGLDKLARQLSQPLDWQACLTACREAGVDTVLELGPGNALAHMARESIPGARCHSMDDFKSLAGVSAWLRT